MAESKAPSAISLTRSIPASADTLYKAWLTPELVQRWGPERATIDARVGGRFRFETDGVEGTFDVHVVRGEYRELVAPKRIVQTWIYQGPLSLDDEVETLVTVEFKDKGPKMTEISLREEGPSLLDAEARRSAREAWEAALDNFSIICTESLR